MFIIDDTVHLVIVLKLVPKIQAPLFFPNELWLRNSNYSEL
jgi:hypothetical protein